MLKDVFGTLAVFADPVHNHIKASHVASIAMMRFKNNDTDDLNRVIPMYLRKSDAEYNRAAETPVEKNKSSQIWVNDWEFIVLSVFLLTIRIY